MQAYGRDYGRVVAHLNNGETDYSGVVGRIPIFDLSPQVSGGLWNAKAFAGEVIPFAATAVREGHDLIGVTLELESPAGELSEKRMRLIAPGTDRWSASVLCCRRHSADSMEWKWRRRSSCATKRIGFWSRSNSGRWVPRLRPFCWSPPGVIRHRLLRLLRSVPTPRLSCLCCPRIM